jgi:putative tricarboxylic transport membrane protein
MRRSSCFDGTMSSEDPMTRWEATSGQATGRRLTRRQALAGLGGTAAVAATLARGPATALAQETRRLHFLVPASVGGGWDQTARAVAEAVTRTGLVESTTLEHVSGGGGARAISYLVATGQTQPQTLMVSSTPIVLRAVRGATPSYRDLQPIAAVLADYAAIAVRADSPHRDFAALAGAVRSTPGSMRVAGGSVRGGMDHLLAAKTFAVASGIDPKQLVYHPYDAGGAAFDALRNGHAEVLSSGLGEVLGRAKAGELRVLAVTAAERVPEAGNLPTLRELGHDLTFVNWRGFFGAPQMPQATADAHAALLGRLVETPEWQAVCARNAWQTLFLPRGEFAALLEAEEATARRTLGALGIA